MCRPVRGCILLTHQWAPEVLQQKQMKINIKILEQPGKELEGQIKDIRKWLQTTADYMLALRRWLTKCFFDDISNSEKPAVIVAG